VLRLDIELLWGSACLQAIPIDIDGSVRHFGYVQESLGPGLSNSDRQSKQLRRSCNPDCERRFIALSATDVIQ
jgi:hypothetical protein